jgi:GDP-D-mannose 3',5'-epimerase
MKVLVAGGTGFVGHWLIRRLKKDGHWVRCVDIKPPRYAEDESDEFLQLDLRNERNCMIAAMGMDRVFNLAADMGGAGFVFTGNNDIDIMRNNTLINVYMLDASHICGVKRYFFSSSACTYPQELQTKDVHRPLKESDAYPANPDSAYGWEKIYTERMCDSYHRGSPMELRIARFHNVCGEECAWNNGREKLPAAAARKVAVAKIGGNPVIDVWGDGQATRTFCHIEDLVEGLTRLMNSDYDGVVNLGTDEPVSVDMVYYMMAEIAGAKIELNHIIDGPVGVYNRNADLTVMRNVLGFEPQISLGDAFRRIYDWVEWQVLEHWDEFA